MFESHISKIAIHVCVCVCVGGGVLLLQLLYFVTKLKPRAKKTTTHNSQFHWCSLNSLLREIRTGDGSDEHIRFINWAPV